MKPTQQEIKDCIAYFDEMGIYAYQDDYSKNVIVNFDEADIAVEITDDEVRHRAELYAYNQANEEGA